MSPSKYDKLILAGLGQFWKIITVQRVKIIDADVTFYANRTSFIIV